PLAIDELFVPLGKRYLFALGIVDGHVESESPQFLNKHVERFRNTSSGAGLSLHYAFVDLRAAIHIVRLDCKKFLECVCGTVCLERPNFHFPETLATKLGLTTERLLGNEAVGTSGSGVHLVVDKVVQLE